MTPVSSPDEHRHTLSSVTWPVVPSTSIRAPVGESVGRAAHVHHARHAVFPGDDRGMRDQPAQLGHDGGRVGERRGVADVGDLRDEDLPRLQFVDRLGRHDAYPAPDPTRAHAEPVQRLAATEGRRHHPGRLPLPAERLGRHHRRQRQLLRTSPRHQSREVGWRSVEFVDGQVEHVVGIAELTGLD